MSTLNPSARPPIWTRAFITLCAAVFLSNGQQSMLTVAIPLYVTSLGHSAFVAGLILLTFSLPSFTFRPFIGYWADNWSTVGVLILGACLLGASSLLYFIPIFAVLVAASAARGLGWAGLMTGGYTLLAHLTPPSRRGEGSAYYSSIFGAAQIMFPAVALWLLATRFGGYGAVFGSAAALSFLSAATGLVGLKPSVAEASAPVHRQVVAAVSKSAAFIDTGVLLATALNGCMALAQPAVSAFLPLYARHLGISGIGWFYIVSGIANLAMRPLLGRVVDRYGRGYSIVPALLAQIAAIGLFVIFGTLPAILLGGLLNAAGGSLNGASTMALAMDLANPERRGKAMATFSLSYQVGNGAGSVLAGALVSFVGYRGMYVGAMVALAAGLALALANWSRIAHVIEPLLPSSPVPPGSPFGDGD